MNRVYIFENGCYTVTDGGYLNGDTIKRFEKEMGPLLSVRYGGREVVCV